MNSYTVDEVIETHCFADYVNEERCIAELSRLLKQGLSINHQFRDGSNFAGETLLHIAVRDDKQDVIHFLILNDIDVNRQKVDHKNRKPDGPQLQSTALYIAVCSQNVPIVKKLICAGADINLVDGSGCTPLWHSVDEQNLELCDTILTSPSCNSVNVQDCFGLSPLHISAMRNNVPIANLLIGHDAILDTQQSQGLTPLCMACNFSCTNVALVFIKHGSRVDLKTSQNYSALRLALERSNDPKLIRALLLSGVKVPQPLNLGLLRLTVPLFYRDETFFQEFVSETLTPKTLMKLSALQIRHSIRDNIATSIWPSIDSLKLPKFLKTFLKELDLDAIE